MTNLAQTIPMNWDELNMIKRRPALILIREAVEMGLKFEYSSVEFKQLNRNGDITKHFDNDIRTFILYCQEVSDKMLIENSKH